MMKNIKISLLLIFCFYLASSSAQDMILMNSGVKLHCKIVREDSVSLFYVLPRQDTPKEVKKSEVHKYVITMPPAPGSSPSATTALQNETKPELLLVNVSGGFANPLGDFASMDIFKSTAGLAKSGYCGQVSLILKVSKYLGVCVAYHYQVHSLDNNLLANQLAGTYRGVNFSTTSTSWKIRGFYGGLYGTLPVKTVEGLSLFASAMIGLPAYVSPQFVTVGIQNGARSSITQGSASTNAIAYLGSVGLMYRIYKRLGVSLSANYLWGKAEFSDVLVSTGLGNTYVDFKQSIESLNIQVGVSYVIE